MEQKKASSSSHPIAQNTARVTRAKHAIHAKKTSESKNRTGKALASALAETKDQYWFFVKSFSGKCPPLSDAPRLVHDPMSSRLYSLGGKLPGDRSRTPTSDFYSLDISTNALKWTDLTHGIQFRNPYDPLSAEECLPENKRLKPLPRLGHPGCTLFRMHNKSFLLMFGGYDDNENRVSSQLIMMDPDPKDLRWWIAPVQGPHPLPRINPAIIAIGNKVYIFGGYLKFGADPQPHYSFSIAEYRDRSWHWIVCDEAYPELAHGKIFQSAIAVCGQRKILLTPGRTTGKARLNFSRDNMLFFQLEEHEFQKVYVYGDFPTDVLWYTCYPIDPAVSEEDSWSVIICAWIPWPEDSEEETAAELWRLRLSPRHEKSERIGVIEKIYQVDQDLQYVFMANEKRLVLIGYEPKSSPGPKDMVSLDSDDEEATVDARGIYNIYLNVPIQS